MNVDWNAFFTAVEEAIELFSRAPMSLGDRIHRFNSVPLAAAKIHVGKPKAGRYTKPWSTRSFERQSKGETLWGLENLDRPTKGN